MQQVFKGKEFHSVGSISKTVPVLTCGGISKRYLVPGWRSGWLIIHDKQGILSEDVSCSFNTIPKVNQKHVAVLPLVIFK